MHLYSKQPSKLLSSSSGVTVKERIAETLQGLTNRLAVKNYLSMCQSDCIISSMFGRKEIDLASISPHSNTKECFQLIREVLSNPVLVQDEHHDAITTFLWDPCASFVFVETDSLEVVKQFAGFRASDCTQPEFIYAPE